MVMSYSLLLFNYTASVVFTSSYVLLMFHLLAPGSMRIIGERAIDTVVGCAIAIAASHLFPYWEYRLMGKLVNNMINATRQYLEASWWWSGKPAAAVVGDGDRSRCARARLRRWPIRRSNSRAPAMATALGRWRKETSTPCDGRCCERWRRHRERPLLASTVKPIADAERQCRHYHGQQRHRQAASRAHPLRPAAAATALDRDYRYRLARKNVHVAFANLGQAFQRMMLEPKSAQKFVPELNGLLVRSHVLASQITAAAPLLRTSAQRKQAESVSLQPLQRALSVVRDNLTEAEAGNAPPADQGEQIKQLSRELDAMVVETENRRTIRPTPCTT